MRARALPVTDRVVRDGGSVVLVGREVVRLSVLATAVLELCGDWVGAEELAGPLVERFGAPPGDDPVAAVEQVLVSLAEHRLVERG